MAYFDNDIDSAWTLIQSSHLDPAGSPLACFVLAQLAIKKGFNDQAIEILYQKPKGPEYYPVYYLDYMLGLAKLHRLDPDAAVHLEKYVQHFKGRHYIKECYQKLAWDELIRGNTAGYKVQMRAVQTNGESVVDEDQQALIASHLKTPPHPVLLQIRLLFDGGYLLRAEQKLEMHYAHLIANEELKLETLYRGARIAHGLKKYAPAIHRYLQVIENGKTQNAYFSCAAALYTGLIYENLQRPSLARLYYDQCLALSPSTYRSSLHQKAKAGIDRLNKK
jgi:tetratricopeptide (TPR) repeat protein